MSDDDANRVGHGRWSWKQARSTTRYLLDTDVSIDCSKGGGAVVSRVRAREQGGDDLGIRRVQMAEYIAGIDPRNRGAGGVFLSAFRRWPITEPAAMQAGVHRSDFARRGVQIALGEAIIVGVARTISATLVTRNVGDVPISDVRISTI